ncbi:MAG: PQQ-dependent sugar dehydrogenase [Longimicrobiales bacterium]
MSPRFGGRLPRTPGAALVALIVAAASACGGDPGDSGSTQSSVGAASGPAADCVRGNDDLSLPDDFCVIVVADDLGSPRHLAVAENGDIFVATEGGGSGPGVVALRDTDGDGEADVREEWGDQGGTGLLLHEGWLYFAPDDGVLRYSMTEGSLTPSGSPETIVSGLPSERSHAAKAMAIDSEGNLFVNIGSPSNTCQEEDRQPGSPGMDPCPELETRAGVWRFDADAIGQTRADGERFATGLRNTVALRIHPATGQLYGVVHGRDMLAQNWPELFDAAYSAENPSEEMVAIDEGDHFGWPYCYHDHDTATKVLAPEYGGDGEEIGRCAEMEDPVVAFPGHWAPNDLEFYTGDHFPDRYRDGGFVAFHGSWNRAPQPQEGYNVVFVPFEGGEPTGEWEVFASGFPEGDVSPGGAEHRPAGVAMGPDGSLYVTDDQNGTLWRIVHAGDETTVEGGGA